MESAVGTGMGVLVALIIMCVVGGIAGLLASIVVKGTGFGLLGNIIVGIVGANIAGWILPALGINLGGIIGVIIAATIGAILVLLAIKLIRKA